MILFSGNCYIVKGRVKELLTTTGLGFEQDQELEKQEPSIIPVLEKLINKLPEVKKTKNAVFFVEFEDAKWLENSKSFKQEPKFTRVCKQCYSPANFKKYNKMVESFDRKDNVSEKMVLKAMSLIGL